MSDLAELETALGYTFRNRELLHQASARAVLRAWVTEREAGLNARQEALLVYLCEERAPELLTFQDYVDLHAGRRAPSLRSLQRDWKGLRDAGWLAPADGELHRLSTTPLEFGG